MNPPPPQYTLQISAENGGTVNNIGGSYPAGTSLTAQATPNQEFAFDKWVNNSGQTISTNNPYTFTLNANTTLKAVFLQNPTTPTNLHVRINAGGNQVTTSGQTWTASQGFSNSLNRNTTQNIQGTSDGILYQTFCISNANLATLFFAYPNLPPGSYRIRLHFVETYWGVQVAGGAGKRVFSVNVEGSTPTHLQNIDFNAIASPLTAIVRETTVNVSDGTLNMSFIPSVDRPSVAAIEIIQEAASSTARVEESHIAWRELITPPMLSPEVKVYPNPFSEQFSIEFQDFISGKAKIRLYNSWGQTIEEKEVWVGMSGKQEISLPLLSEGLYFLEVQTEQFSKVLRIVKQ